MNKAVAKPFETETLSECPNCLRDNLEHWANAKDELLGRDEQTFEYAKCCDCQTVFARSRPTAATISYFYEGDYSPYDAVNKNRIRFRKLHKFAMKIADRITGLTAAHRQLRSIHAQQLNPDATFLDFGCGGGALLDAYKRQFQCQTIGMDFNESLFPSLQARGHRILSTDNQSWQQLPDSSVDLVVMNHVLEHIYDPKRTLGQIRRILKPSGVLDIAIPNPQGLSATLYKSAWFALDCPRHIILFTPQSAQDLLLQCGFNKVRSLPFPVTKDLVRSKARHKREVLQSPLEHNGLRALQEAFTVRRSSLAGQFDQFHLIASI